VGVLAAQVDPDLGDHLVVADLVGQVEGREGREPEGDHVLGEVGQHDR
jgi:hypothetical protein